MAIREWEQGQRVEAFVALRKLERREYPGGERLSLEFGDQSGRIEAVMWEGFDTAIDELEVGGVVKVRGIVGTYKDRPQVRVERIRAATADEALPADFLPHSPVSPEDLECGLAASLASLTDPDLRGLMEYLFTSGDLRAQYLAAPAGKLWHHNTVGGLAEHSLNVARLCEFACEMYPYLDRDLLVCGAVLHDLGKIDQYEATAMFDYTDQGRLVGHINTGDQRVAAAIGDIPDFPAETAMVLRHLIVSHQGEFAKGSPVVPMTPEAFVLHFADELDSQMGALRRIADKTGDAPWSEFVNLIGRYIYFGHRQSRNEPAET
jgi:3'-5' exoribonuclease